MSEQVSDLVVVETEYVELGSLKAAGPVAVVQQATTIATELAKIIDSRRLFSTISGKKFVRVEGWTTLGAMLGVLPREVMVDRLEDGSYEALVELIRANDGMVIGRASALCGMDEKRWGSANEYARRSMAITRATGKAYRLGFSWIMTLAGYEPTPAEEMPQEPQQSAKKTTNGKAARPLPADKLYAFLYQKIEKAPDVEREVKADQPMVSLLAGKLEECFAPNENARDMRLAVLEYLFKVDSAKDLTIAQARAVLDWIMLDESGIRKTDRTYALHKDAYAEAAGLYAATLKTE